MATYSLRHHILSRYQANSFLLVSPPKAASSPVSRGIMSFHPSKTEQNLSSVTCLPSPRHQIYQIMAVLPLNSNPSSFPHLSQRDLPKTQIRSFAHYSNIPMACHSLQNKVQVSSVLPHSLFTCASFQLFCSPKGPYFLCLWVFALCHLCLASSFMPNKLLHKSLKSQPNTPHSVTAATESNKNICTNLYCQVPHIMGHFPQQMLEFYPSMESALTSASQQ